MKAKPNSRRIELNLPIMAGSTITRRRFLAGTGVILTDPAILASTDAAQREYLMNYALAEDVHVVNLLEMGHHTGTEFPQAGFGKKFRMQRGNFALVSGQEDPRSTLYKVCNGRL